MKTLKIKYEMDKTRTDVINLLLKNYNFHSYLEIGAWIPEYNFDKINASLKHSVDPGNDGDYTYNMTSDDFFFNHIGDRKYDVIFVDGLHTAEQAYIDVINSIHHLNKNGFIVMHDCNPPDLFLARTYEEYLNDRSGWCGTVYKAFIKLKYQLRNWSFFVIDEDFGCGVLTRNDIYKKTFLPNIDYNNIDWNTFDQNRKELLQLITFEEYEQLIVNKINKNK